ncbi:MAG: helix-turn-helix domain-containing protein [Deltaproteobacteria bacterium]|nr:helix-turn-helix domain-containing protein [Deltaproteobacteria bacterium]
MSLRLEFVLRSLTEPTPFRTLCAEYGVSPKTGYKWKQRFFQEGSSGLHDQSRRPAASPAALPEQVVCEIVRLKQAHRTWGPRKIRELYARRHRAQPLPSESSVKRVLDKAGLVEKRRSRRSRDTGRLQSRVDAQAPNDVWTVDFKGWWYTPTHERCEPFTVRDAYSRYVLASAILPDARTETVQQACEGLFERYGLPGTIRSDNGRPFAATTAPLGVEPPVSVVAGPGDRPGPHRPRLPLSERRARADARRLGPGPRTTHQRRSGPPPSGVGDMAPYL